MQRNRWSSALRRGIVLAVVGLLAGLTALLPAAGPAVAAGPGTLISAKPLPPPRSGGNAYSIVYESTGLQGQPIQITGMVIVPRGTAPAGGRPIVAWAHPTTGIAEACAPSLANNVRYVQLQGLNDMLQRGYIVAAPDYPGLGSPGPHPYLIGVSEARSVLDAIRAAQQLTHNPPGPVAVWGHSQGGQAVLYSGLIASSYAPELKLVGIAAAAPATELGKLMLDAEPTPGGKNILAMTLWSWNEVFNAPIDKVVLPAAMPTVKKLASTCIENIIDVPGRMLDGRALQQRFLSVDDLTALDPWKTILAQNTIGTLPKSIPLFIAQGTTDDTVDPQVTAQYVKSLCAAGSKVTTYIMPGIGHLRAAQQSAPTAIAWIADRFAGAPAPSNCGS